MTTTTFKGSPSVERPPAKKGRKLPLRRQSSFKILPTVTTRMTPLATKEIQKELGDIAQKRWDKKLSSDKIKSLVEKCKQPQNCTDVKGVKVNPEIWSQLTAKQRKTDLKISNLQQIIHKTTFATLQTTSMLINNSSVPDNNKIMAQQVDTIAMLGHVNTQLAQL